MNHSVRLIFLCFYFVPLKNVHLQGNVTNAGEGLRLLTYIRHSWLLGSKCSLVSTTVTRGICFQGNLQDPLHWNLLRSVCQWSCQNLLYWNMCVATKVRTPISRMRGECCTTEPQRWFVKLISIKCDQSRFVTKSHLLSMFSKFVI